MVGAALSATVDTSWRGIYAHGDEIVPAPEYPGRILLDFHRRFFAIIGFANCPCETLKYRVGSRIVIAHQYDQESTMATPSVPTSRLTGRGFMLALALITVAGCTQETQNKFGRAVQNWTGTNGVLDIYAGEKLVNRFIEIDKVSTAVATKGDSARAYRFGYGVLDLNQNFQADAGEKKVYFEFSDYSTSYIFYENPYKKSG